MLLDGVSFDFEDGKVYGLLGPNGAGKTTSLMAISNLVDKEEGSVTFKGQDISRMPPAKIVTMGMQAVWGFLLCRYVIFK